MRKEDFLRVLNKDADTWAFHIGELAGMIMYDRSEGTYSIAYGLYPGMKDDPVQLYANSISELLKLPVVNGQSLEDVLEIIERMYTVPIGN